MEDHTENTSRTLTPQKTDFYESAKESDEGVCNRKCRYWRDDGSKTETSQEGPSDQLTTNRKRHKGDHKIINVLDKRIYYTIVNAYEDKINMLINSREKISTFLNSVGLDTNIFIQDFTRRIEILQKSIKKYDYRQDFRNFGELERFLEHYINKRVLQHKYKTIEAPKIKNIFRSLSPVVSKQAKIDESGEDSYNLISSIVVIQGGIVTYSRHYKTICCVRIDGERNDIHCPSSVTDFTRIGEETVLVTLPFRQMILIISPSSCKIKTLPVGFYKLCYLEHSTFIGVEMFNKTIFLTDWDNNRITNQFIAKEVPADIALGPQNNLLISFANINRVTSYTLDGQQLFEVYTNSLDIPTHITVYQNHFYALQGHIIYRISGTGDVSQREIGTKYQQISVGSNTIFLIDYFGVPRTIRMTKDFWPRSSYNNQLRTPTFNDHMYTEDSHNITSILPVSSSSILIFYRNMKAILITDIGDKISQKYLTFPFVPSVCCRLNSNTFLVFYHGIKNLQVIKCPELTKGHLIKVHTDYIKLCHVVSNKCLALTTSQSKEEVHILLVKEYKVDIINRIPLEHGYVTIAATPINFVVVDGRKHKLVFYSLSGEVLFEKYLQFYGYPHHIYTDNVYYYVLFKSESLVICYDIYGEIKWQWKLPLTICPHVAVFQGTIYMVDIVLNRVLLYKYHDWSGCRLLIKNPYIKNLNIRLDGNANNKVVIAEICHLPNGQLVMSDINNDCLLFISNEGDIVSTFPLPSTATDIYRWDCNQIGVTLPLEKQLQVVGNLSKRVRTVSLRRPYLRVRKLGKGQIFCYCDKPSHHLDIVSIRKCNQGEIIWTLKIPFVVKSLEIENESLNILIVTKKKVFKYTSDSRRSHRHRLHLYYGRTCRINLKPTVVLSQMKPSLSLYGGCIDKMFIYLIDNCRMFAINDHNLVVRDHVTNSQLNMYIDFVDVFSRNMCVSEMLSSTLYLQDLTVSDKARHIDDVPQCFGDKLKVELYFLVITENNLIAGFDMNNKNIKIFTFDGQHLDSVKLNAYDISMCRWQSNTLVIATGDNEHRLLTLKVEFPLSLIAYQTRNNYLYIASLSDNLLVCSTESDVDTLYVVDIDEIHSTVNVIKRIEIPETLTRDRCFGSKYISLICAVIVTANDDIVVSNAKFIIIFNRNGQYLHSIRHYMWNSKPHSYMTANDCYLYIHGPWERYVNYVGYDKAVCLTLTGEYNSIFLNKTRCKDIVDFTCINCKGPRFVGRHWSTWKLYVEGLFNVNRERYPVCRLQTDNRPVQVKDIDISDEGHTVVCENANTGNIKIFDRDGELLCYRDLGTLVGGVCFTGERDIMVTVPNRREIFQLKQQDLAKYKVLRSRVPYGVIWRKVGSIYWCVHINLTKYHCIKIDGDQLEVLESMPLLKLDSGLYFPSITSQTNNEIFSDELINKLKQSGEAGGGSDEAGKIAGNGRLKVRCGNYIAETMSGIDEISVRKLPYRTAMVPLSIPTWDEPVNYDIEDSRDYSSKLIKLDDNVSVLMFRDTVTVITTATGDILQHKQLQHQPLDICRWTDECFIVAFRKQLMFFKRGLFHFKTINTEKYYNSIYKNNDNQLVCGGHYIVDIPEGGSYNYYVDIVDIDGGTCKYSREVCSGVAEVEVRAVKVGVVCDIVVTSGGDIIVVKLDKERCNDGRVQYDVCCYREHLIRSIKIPIDIIYYIYRPYLTTHGEYVYITDKDNNIYQIPRYNEHQTSEDIVHQTVEDISQYLLLSGDDNEVSAVLGFDISDNSFMVFGIIPGRQSFGFIHYEK